MRLLSGSRLDRRLRPPKVRTTVGALVVATVAEFGSLWEFVMLWLLMTILVVVCVVLYCAIVSGANADRELEALGYLLFEEHGDVDALDLEGDDQIAVYAAREARKHAG